MSVKTKALGEKLSTIAREKPLCVSESAAVSDVIALMRREHSHCALVIKGRRLAGIFTERDYLMKVFSQADPSDKVGLFMTPEPIVGRIDETIGEAVEVMNEKGVRNLPLTDEEGVPASLATVGGLIRYLADHFPVAVVNRPPDPHRIGTEMEGA